MENQVNLEDITDINELYKMKSDEYDKMERGQLMVREASHNIPLLNARIDQLAQKSQAVEGEVVKKKA